MTRAPSRRACLTAIRVSMVSPDCEIATTRVWSLTTGSRYRNSWARSTSHGIRVQCEVDLAHEFRYRDPVVNDHTLVVAISQSGETIDTLMAVKHARLLGARVIAICNTHGSTIPRESDAVLYTHAGPEIAVASTKAFLAQITACYILGLYLAQLRGGTYADEAQAVMKDLCAMPAKIQTVLD